MDENVCLLLSIYNASDETMIQCAMKIPHAYLGEYLAYPMEPECRTLLRKLLPPHIRDIGPIIDVAMIFDIHVDSGVK